MNRRAHVPFRFVSCMELREVLSLRAHDEQRLLELIEEVPPDSIYYHTHSFFLRHAYIQGRYPNDFATWVAAYVQDHLLGERLGAIDPFDYEDIEALRTDIAGIIADHLSRARMVQNLATGEPFEFIRSHVIEVDLGVEAWTLQEFRNALAQVEIGAIYNHACEARMRQKRLPGDFASWLLAKEGLAMPELAEQMIKVGRLGLELEGVRERMVALCDQALAAA